MKAIELEQLFPNQGQIPVEFDLTKPLEQKEYLVNGEMRAWKGKTQDVWVEHGGSSDEKREIQCDCPTGE